MNEKFGDKISRFILYGFPIALFVVLVFGLQFNGLYGQDSHTYLKYAVQLRESQFSNFTSDQYYWPIGYPILGAGLSLIGIPINYSLLLISLISILVAIYYLQRILLLVYGQQSNWWILIGAASSVYFVRSGMLVMSDMLAASMIIGVFYHYVSFKNQNSIWHVWGMIVLAIGACLIRYASIFLVLLPVGYALYKVYRNANWLHRVLFIGLTIIGLIIVVVYNNQFLSTANHLIAQWSPGNWFKSTFSTLSGIQKYPLPNFLQVALSSLHPGYLSIGIFLLPFLRHLQKIDWSIWLSVLIYYLFLAGLEIQNYRYFILNHLLILIWIYPAFAALKQFLLKKRLFYPTMIGFLVLNVGLFSYSFSKTYKVHRFEKELATYIKSLQTESRIYSFEVDQSFSSYGIINEAENLYYREIEYFLPGALVIFNEQKFSEKWKNTPVMNNWNRLIDQHTLDTVRIFENGWGVFKISSTLEE